MKINKEFETLSKENNKLRDILNIYLPVIKSKNNRVWKLINDLIDNEIKQEGFCNI